MTKEELFGKVISTPDADIYSEIKKNWDHISKPIDALGDFEDVVCRIGSIQGRVSPVLKRRVLLVFCSDNGIVSEGISQSGPDITLKITRMLGSGISSANTIGRSVGAECIPVDVGIECDEDIPGVINYSQRRGSRNFLNEPAMTEEEALGAIEAGIELTAKLAGEGADILLSGEMGIGNTTTATALLCLLNGGDTRELTGRGAGLSDEGLARKMAVIKRAVEIYGGEEFSDDRERAFAHLCEVGGYDIAAMCGMFIGGALAGVPVVIDGLISAVAALTAEMIIPGCREYMLPSHSGREHGVNRVLDRLGLRAFINGNMAFGEGTGALMLLPLLDVALDFYGNASTFARGGIEEYKRLS